MLLTFPVVLSLKHEGRTFSFCTYLLPASRMPSTVLALGATAVPEADTVLALLELTGW